MAVNTATLLLTRPPHASDQFWASLPLETRTGLELCLSPLLEIVPLAVPPLQGISGLIFTSAVAPELIAKAYKRRDVTCYCVGQATARAAQDHGFLTVCFDGDADQLVQGLIERRPPGRLLHLHGLHTTGSVAGRLNQAGLNVQNHAVYDQRLQPLSDGAITAFENEGTLIAPVFSPRTAQQLADEIADIPSVRATLSIVAISKNAMEPLNGTKAAFRRIAASPNASEMIKLVSEAIQQASRVERSDRAK